MLNLVLLKLFIVDGVELVESVLKLLIVDYN